GAPGGAQVEVDGVVELLTGALEVALLDLGHARGQMGVGLGDEARDGVTRGRGPLGGVLLRDTPAVSAGGGGKRGTYEDNPLPAPGQRQAPPSADGGADGRKERRILAQPGDGLKPGIQPWCGVA